MNKIFKTKFSTVKQEIIVVSELANNKDKTASQSSSSSITPQKTTALFPFSLSKPALIVGLFIASLFYAEVSMAGTSVEIHDGKVGADSWLRNQGAGSVALNPDANKPNQNAYTAGGSVAVGYNSQGGEQGTAVGQNARASNQATALGADTVAQGEASIAIGSDDLTQGQTTSSAGGTSKVYKNYDYSDYLPEQTLKEIFSGLIGAGKRFSTEQEFFKAYGRYNANAADDTSAYSPTYAGGLGAIAIGSRTIAGGEVSTAVGALSFALAKGSTAMGLRAYVDKSAEGGTAIGQESRTFAAQSVAIGNKTEASNQGSMAYGYEAKAVGQGAIAIGANVAAGGKFNTTRTAPLVSQDANTGAYAALRASGKTDDDIAKFTKKFDEVLSAGMPLSKENKVYLTTSSGNIQKTASTDASVGGSANAIAIGNKTFASKSNSVAFGSYALADAINSFALGSYSLVGPKAKNTIAIGVGTYAGDASNSFIGGTWASSEAADTLVLGTNANIGKSSISSISLGKQSVIGASSPASVAFGNLAKIGQQSDSAVAVGTASSIGSDSRYAMALGTSSSIGNNSASSIALGKDALVAKTEGEKAPDSLAIGTGARVDAKESDTGTLYTPKVYDSTQNAFVDFKESKNYLDKALAIGFQAKVSRGAGKMETGIRAMAIGARAHATLENSVALGVNSKTDYTWDQLETDPWVAKGTTSIPTSGKTGVISVGSKGSERRIVNVASGSFDTDAVNVAQLKTIEERFQSEIDLLQNGGGVQYLAVEKTNINGEAGNVASQIRKGESYEKYVKLKSQLLYLTAREKLNGETFNATAMQKIKDAVTELEKEYSGELKTTAAKLNEIATALSSESKAENYDKFNQYKAKIESATTTDGEKSVGGLAPEKLAELKKDNNYLNDGAKGLDSIAFGWKASTSGDTNGQQGKQAIAIGFAAKANAEKAISIGSNTNTTMAGSVAIGENAEVTAGGKPSIALGKLSRVANSSITATTTATTVGSLTFTSFAGSPEKLGVLSIGDSGKERKITNVAAGEVSQSSTEAINGSQLYATNLTLNKVAEAVKNNFGGNAKLQSSGVINFSNIGETGQSTIHNAIKSVRDQTIQLSGNSGNTTAKAIKNNPTFGIKGDGTDITSTASGDNVTFSLNKSTTVAQNDEKAVTSKAVYSAIQTAKPTVTKKDGEQYIEVDGNKSSDIAGNTFKVGLNLTALTTNLADTFAKTDASNVINSAHQENWRNKLNVYSKDETYSKERTNELIIASKVELATPEKDLLKVVKIPASDETNGDTWMLSVPSTNTIGTNPTGSNLVTDKAVKDYVGSRSILLTRGNTNNDQSSGQVDLSQKQILGVYGDNNGADITTNAVGNNINLTLNKASSITQADTKVATSAAVYSAIKAAKASVTAATGGIVTVSGLKGDNIDGDTWTVGVNYTSDNQIGSNPTGNKLATDLAVKNAVESAVDKVKILRITGDDKAGTSSPQGQVDLSQNQILGVKGTAGEIETSASGNNITLKLADSLMTSINNKVDTETYKAGTNINKESWKKALDIAYKANSEAAKTTTLADGFAFTNGTNTTAEVGDKGVVKFNLNKELTGISSIEGETGKAKLTFGDTLQLNDKKLTGLANGSISSNSKDAITGGQLSALLGKDPDSSSNTFTDLGGISGATTINAALKTLNDNFSKGYKIKANKDVNSPPVEGTEHKLEAGSTLNVLAAETPWGEENGPMYAGDNLQTSFNGTNNLYIGLKEKPTFKALTLSNGTTSTATTTQPNSIELNPTGLTASFGGNKTTGFEFQEGKIVFKKANGSDSSNSNVQLKGVADATEDNDAVNFGQYKALKNLDKAGKKVIQDQIEVEKADSENFITVIKENGSDDGSSAKKFKVGLNTTSDLDNTANGANTNKIATAEAVKTYVDKKVDGLSQNLNLTDGSTDKTLNLKSEKLKVVGTEKQTSVTLSEESANKVLTVALASDIENIDSVTFNKTGTDPNEVQGKISSSGVKFTKGNDTTGSSTTLAEDGLTIDKTENSTKQELVKVSKEGFSVKDADSESKLAPNKLSIGAENAEHVEVTKTGIALKENGTTGKSSITLASDAITLAGAATDSAIKLTGVADGQIAANSKDAINGGQIRALLGVDNGEKIGGTEKTTISEAIKDVKDSVTKAKLKYTANSATAKQEVLLSEGLDFKNGTNTTATVAENGEVKYNLNSTLNEIDTVNFAANSANKASLSAAGLVFDDAKNASENNRTTFAKDGVTLTKTAAGGTTSTVKVAEDGFAISNGTNQSKLGADKLTLGNPSSSHMEVGTTGLALKDGETNKASVTLADSAITLAGAATGTAIKLTGVADGSITANSKDAINGGQIRSLLGVDGGEKIGGTEKTTISEAIEEVRKTTASVAASKLSYKSTNDSGNTKTNEDSSTQQKGEVTLAEGLDFRDGKNTTSEVSTSGGVVKYHLNPTLDDMDTINFNAQKDQTNKAKLNADGLVIAADPNNITTGNSTVLGKDGVTLVKGDATVKLAEDGFAISNGTNQSKLGADKLTLGNPSSSHMEVGTTGLTLKEGTADKASVTLTDGAIKLASTAANTAIKLTGVANGAITDNSTDAINGGQLKSVLGFTPNDTTTSGTGNNGIGGTSATTIAGAIQEVKNSVTEAKLKYTANSATSKQEVLLSEGLDFKNGTNTTATVAANGEVKYNLNSTLDDIDTVNFAAKLANKASLSATGLVFDDATTASENNRTTFAKDGVTLARTATDGTVTTVKVAEDGFGVQAVNGSAVQNESKLSADKLTIGTPTGDHVELTGSGIARKNNTDNTASIALETGKVTFAGANNAAVNLDGVAKATTDNQAVNFAQYKALESLTDAGKKVIQDQVKGEADGNFITVSEEQNNGSTPKKIKVGLKTASKEDLNNNTDLANKVATAEATKDYVDSKVNGLSQTLNLTDGSNNQSLDLKNETLKVVGTDNQTIVNLTEDSTAKTKTLTVALASAVSGIDSVTFNKTGDDPNQVQGSISSNGVKFAKGDEANGSTTTFAEDGLTIDKTADSVKQELVKVSKEGFSVKDDSGESKLAPNKLSVGAENAEHVEVTKTGIALKNDSANTASIALANEVITLAGAVGAEGSSTAIKLTGVADGSIATDSKDAINGGQIRALLGVDKDQGIGGTSKTTISEAIQEVKKATEKVAASKLNYKSTDKDGTTKTNASDSTEQKGEVTLADGLDFRDGKNTTSEVAASGVVKYHLNSTLNEMDTINFNAQPGQTEKAKLNADGLVIAEDPNNIATGNSTVLGKDGVTLVKNDSTVKLAEDGFSVKNATSESKLGADKLTLGKAGEDHLEITKDKITAKNGADGKSSIQLGENQVILAGKNGTDGAKLTGVGDGSITSNSKDAINGKQLYEVLGVDPSTKKDEAGQGIGGTAAKTIDGAISEVRASLTDAELTYRENSATDGTDKVKKVKLSKGLDFSNGTNTTAEVGDNGIVKYNLNSILNNIDTINFAAKAAQKVALSSSGLVFDDETDPSENSRTTFAKDGVTLAKTAADGRVTSVKVAEDGFAINNGTDQSKLGADKLTLGDPSASHMEVGTTGLTLKEGETDKASVTLANEAITLAGAAAGTPIKLTGVADGTISSSSTDAVNGKQIRDLLGTDPNSAIGGTTKTNISEAINEVREKTEALAATNFHYKATDSKGAAKTDNQVPEKEQKGEVSLTQGLDFRDGKNTSSEVADNGVVKYHLNETLDDMDTINFKSQPDQTNKAKLNADGLVIADNPNDISSGNSTVLGKDGVTLTRTASDGAKSTVKVAEDGFSTQKIDAAGAVVSESKLGADKLTLGTEQGNRIEITNDKIAAKNGDDAKSSIQLGTEAITLAGKNGTDAVKLTGVGDGSITSKSKDAINGKQLYDVLGFDPKDKTAEADKGIGGTASTTLDGAIREVKTSLTNAELTYRANKASDDQAKKVQLSKGLDFTNGTNTTAEVDNEGVVKYHLNTTLNGMDTINFKSQSGETETAKLNADGLVFADDLGDNSNRTTFAKDGVTLTKTAAGGATSTVKVAEDGFAISNGTNQSKLGADKLTLGDPNANHMEVGTTGLTLKEGATDKASVTLTNDAIKLASTAADTAIKLTGIANGSITDNSTDAINGGQLKSVLGFEPKNGTNGTTTAGDGIGGTSATTIAGAIKEVKDSVTGAKLKYTANSVTDKKEVLLSDGLDFKNGTNTTATVAESGEVKYNLNTTLDGMDTINFNAQENQSNKAKLNAEGLVFDDATNASENNRTTFAKDGVTLAKTAADGTTSTVKVAEDGFAISNGTNQSKLGADKLTLGDPNANHMEVGTTGLTLKDGATDKASVTLADNAIKLAGATADTAMKLTGVANGSMAEGSNEAINGGQINKLLGFDPATLEEPNASKKGIGGTSAKTIDGAIQALNDKKLKYIASDKDGTQRGSNQEVAIDSGLNFKDGTNTTSSVDANGVVQYSLNSTLVDIEKIDFTAKEGNKASLDSTGLTFNSDPKDGNATTFAKDGLTLTRTETDGNVSTIKVAEDGFSVQKTDSTGTVLNESKLDAGKLTLGKEQGDHIEITNDKIAAKNGADGKSSIQLGTDAITLAGQNGSDAVKLTGVGDGSITSKSKDAINGKQLYEVLGFDPKDKTTEAGKGIGGTAAKTIDGAISEVRESLTNAELTYRANSATDTDAKTVKLSKGLDFTNGTNTTAEVGDDGVVKYNLNSTLNEMDTINFKPQSGQTEKAKLNANGLVFAENLDDPSNASSTTFAKDGVTLVKTAADGTTSTVKVADDGFGVKAVNAEGAVQNESKLSADKLTIGTPTGDHVELTGSGIARKNNDQNLASISLANDTVTLAGQNNGSAKLTGLSDGALGDDSKDAITGKQLTALATIAGVELNEDKTGFKSFAITKAKDKSGAIPQKDGANASYTSLKDAVEGIIGRLNEGLVFSAEGGKPDGTNKGTQYLGSTLDFVTGKLSDSDNDHSGENIEFAYTNSNGDGKFTLGLKKDPRFDTVKVGADSDNQLVLTSTGISSKVKEGDNSVVDGAKINFGKDTITLSQGADSDPSKPVELKGVASVLDKIKDTEGSTGGDVVDGTAETGKKELTVLDKLKKAAESSASSVVNIGDLDKVATAITEGLTNTGLKFAGDDNTEVSRKLGDTLTIKGGISEKDKLTNGNIGVIKGSEDGSLLVQLAKQISEITSIATNTEGNSKAVLGVDGVTVTGLKDKENGAAEESTNGTKAESGAKAHYGLAGATITDEEGNTATTNAASTQFVDKDGKTSVQTASGVVTADETHTSVLKADGLTMSGQEGNSQLTSTTLTLSDNNGKEVSHTAAGSRFISADGDITAITDKGIVSTSPDNAKTVSLNSDGVNIYNATGGMNITPNGFTFRNPDNSENKNAPSISVDGINAGGKKITNVADGDISPTSNDVVTGRQLYALMQKGISVYADEVKPTSNTATSTNTPNTSGDTATTGATTSTTSPTNTGTGGSATTTASNGDISPTQPVLPSLNTALVDDHLSVPLGGSLKVQGDHNVKTTLAAENEVNLSLQPNIAIESSLLVGSNDPDKAKLAAQEGNAFVVANKETGNGALVFNNEKNMLVLSDTQDNPRVVVDGQNGGITLVGNDNSQVTLSSKSGQDLDGNPVSRLSVKSERTAADGSVQTVDTTFATMDDGLIFKAGDTQMSKKLNQTVEIVGDDNITTSITDEKVKVALNKSITIDEVKIANNDPETQDGDQIVINNNGIHAGNKVITGVQASDDPTSAVNRGQLNTVINHIQNNFEQVNRNINQLTHESRAGIAGALATASLQNVTLPGKTTISVGTATFKGENAVAIGMSRLSDNGKIGIRLSGMSTSNGDTGAAMSVGFTF